jgi:hypothetical protein
MNMELLKREDLYSLEDYSEVRNGFRTQVLEHKKHRKVALGPNATVYFEDRLTIQYQVQEMLRVERIFNRKGIEEELTAYNPLIPDGSNLKATFMLEYEDPEERRRQLARLIGIEDKVWVKVADGKRVFAIADEDMERETEEKTSSVHFLRFELTESDAGQLKEGASISAGIDHENYRHEIAALAPPVRDSLAADMA